MERYGERESVKSKTNGERHFPLDEQTVNLRGLFTIAEIGIRTLSVKKRYDVLLKHEQPLVQKVLEPKKTILASVAALETYSDIRLEDLHREKLLMPVVMLYDALACQWDDCMDGLDRLSPEAAMQKKNDSGLSASEIWKRGVNLIKSNPNISQNNKPGLILDLEKAKTDYIHYETQLQNPAYFYGRDCDDILMSTIEMRGRSFGEISKVMTRVFTKGVKDKVLERNMRNITLALGVIDGYNDIAEDEANGTMTEARALLLWKVNKLKIPSAKNVSKKIILPDVVKYVGKLLS